jgi:hypothetical protein
MRAEQGDFPHGNWRKVPFPMFKGELIHPSPQEEFQPGGISPH